MKASPHHQASPALSAAASPIFVADQEHQQRSLQYLGRNRYRDLITLSLVE